MSSKNEGTSLPSSKDADNTSMDFLTSGSGSGLGRRPTVRTGSLDRLPSLRPKRDLTLGGVPKKSFAPTIPTSRRIKKEPENLESPVAKRDGKHKPDKKGRKGKRRGKEVIASASVFSMGPADRGMHGRRGSAPSGGSQASDDIRFIKKPSNLSNSDNKIKSELPSEDMEDQYEPLVDTSMDDLFSNSQHPPIQLPLDYQLHTRHRLVVPKKVKVVKDEPMDFTDSSAAMVDSKETKSLTLAKAMVAPPSQVKTHQINVADLFTPTDPTKGQFLFLQLPDRLPTSKGQEAMEVEAKGSQVPSSKSESSCSSSNTNDKDEKENSEQRHCSLRDMSEGLIGKLRVHKSGKVRLMLGDVWLDVSMGTPCGFLQELACVRKENPEPKITVLGQLSHRLVCTPDFEALLSQSDHSNR